MSKKIKNIIKQAFHFFIVSGIGWLIDMLIYTIISHYLPVFMANIISSTVSVTYVYIVSTKKIFANAGIDIKIKYLIYIIYQIIMITTFSFVISGLAKFLGQVVKSNFVLKYSKICAKILVTPITMVLNFLFMKFLIEKVGVKQDV